MQRFTRDPRRQTRANWRSAKDILARIQEIVCEYCSLFLAAISSAQLSMVSYAFLPHPSSSCKYKQREWAMLNIQHSPRVQPLLVVFMDVIDLLWFLVPVRLGIRVTNPHIKECWTLGIPEATRPNLQSCILCSIGPSTELNNNNYNNNIFWCNVRNLIILHLTPLVQRVDSTIQWITQCFDSIYPLNSSIHRLNNWALVMFWYQWVHYYKLLFITHLLHYPVKGSYFRYSCPHIHVDKHKVWISHKHSIYFLSNCYHCGLVCYLSGDQQYIFLLWASVEKQNNLFAFCKWLSFL